MSEPLSDSLPEPIRDASDGAYDHAADQASDHASGSLAHDLSAAAASKDLLQQMEELLATVSASLAGLGADLRSSAAQVGTPDDEAPLPDAHG
ncbi:hypothetical protein [Kitasatospora sp. DSM 101779]|uniref:hypothetical protein n=1 Tax=Kitasatospora sp. DSM 101779 TaxID=2853165 RepID=UPI0021DB1DFE|nr:hypothetical protein [Kitasatospora sp. DSM 101779]MCU7824766.1 hypothetical protein [Kitasatospora sp. DSM 101779]